MEENTMSFTNNGSNNQHNNGAVAVRNNGGFNVRNQNQQSVTPHTGSTSVAKELRTQVAVIQDVMKAVMKDGQHYGVIQGCGNKPVLLKAGAEKLMATFKLGVDPQVEVEDTGDSLTYRVTAKLFNIADGNFVGSGVGEASTLEDKYNWKASVSDAEWKAVAEDRKRIKYSASNPTWDGMTKQVRTNYKDVANTVLKMAKKRALVDAVLTCTAASDIFTQDLEDFDDVLRQNLVEDDKPRGGNYSQQQQYVDVTPSQPQSSPQPQQNQNNQQSSSIQDEGLLLALKQLGLSIEEKDGWIKIVGNTYGKNDMIKSLGFRWFKEQKIWAKQL